MKGDLLSGVIIVIIVVVSTILVLNTVNPIINQGRQLEEFNEAKQALQSLDSVINQVIYEAPGSKRTIDIHIPKGKFQVIQGEDKIKVRIENINLFPPGLRQQEGNVLITSGSQMKAYESDIDGDGNTDLVLENGRVLFAIKKLGNYTNNVIVNTTNFISLIRNKNLNNLDVPYPKSGIFINDKSKSAYGVGYTELTKIGDSLTSSSIHVFVNATEANVAYDAVFSLAASQDFVEMEVTHVSGV